MERVQDSEVKTAANFRGEMANWKKCLLRNEDIAKIPGKCPDFFVFETLRSGVEVWYNWGRKD